MKSLRLVIPTPVPDETVDGANVDVANDCTGLKLGMLVDNDPCCTFEAIEHSCELNCVCCK